MSGRLIIKAKVGVEPEMTSRDRDAAWAELRQRVGAGEADRRKSRDFWEEIFGSEGMSLWDDEGNDQTEIVRALVERLDQTTTQVLTLAERVAVLERLVVEDEARINLEIEKLRTEGR